MSSQPRHPILLTRSYSFGLAVFALFFGGWLHLNSHSYNLGSARLDASHNSTWWIGSGRGALHFGWGKNAAWSGPEREISLNGISKGCEWDPLWRFDGQIATPTSPLTRLEIPLWPLPALWAVLFAGGMFRLHRQTESGQYDATPSPLPASEEANLTPPPSSSPRPEPPEPEPLR